MLTAAVLARHWGLTVLATTRSPAKADALQEFLDAGLRVPVAEVYPMDRIAEAHDDMGHNRVAGKLVVTV